MRSLNLATKAKLTPLFLVLSIAYGGNVWAQTCYHDAGNNITPSTPNSQLTDHGDGTVTDTKTGLMWKQCSEGQTGASCTGTATEHNWKAALKLADIHTFAGHSDWRLPNLKELLSIVERACVNPSINATRFPNTPRVNFWSSSAYAGNSDKAMDVYFSNGYAIYYGRGNSRRVRLVRAGQ